MRSDLHIHTTASDGSWDPQQLLREIKNTGIEAFAVTDHDTVASVKEAEKLAAAAGLVFLPGIEINTTKDGHNYHILGYGINTTDSGLLDLCRHNQDLMEERDNYSIETLEEKGAAVSTAEFASYSYDRHRGGWKGLSYLIDKGVCVDVNDFFKRVFTAENGLYFPEFPSVAEAVDVIHNAGGIAICAHLASSFHGGGIDSLLPHVADEKLDGFECYHSQHTEENSRLLAEYCKEKGIFISGGSDTHGPFVPGRILGRPEIHSSMLNLPFDGFRK